MAEAPYSNVQYLAEAQYHFANRVAVYEFEEMVHLDFVQTDPESGDQVGVARLVIRPSLAGQVAERLSALRRSDG